MKRHAAELITRDPERFFHHDRVFLNNPVVMQGMGLAPLVVLATSGQNALMLAVAVALLLDFRVNDRSESQRDILEAVSAWTLESRDDLRQLFRLDPELVVTNKPEVAVSILTGLGQWDESSKEG